MLSTLLYKSIFPGFTRALATKVKQSIKHNFTFVWIGYHQHCISWPHWHHMCLSLLAPLYLVDVCICLTSVRYASLTSHYP